MCPGCSGPRSPSRRPGEQRHQSYTAASWFDGLADDEADFARRNPVDVLGGLNIVPGIKVDGGNLEDTLRTGRAVM